MIRYSVAFGGTVQFKFPARQFLVKLSRDEAGTKTVVCWMSDFQLPTLKCERQQKGQWTPQADGSLWGHREDASWLRLKCQFPLITRSLIEEVVRAGSASDSES